MAPQPAYSLLPTTTPASLSSSQPPSPTSSPWRWRPRSPRSRMLYGVMFAFLGALLLLGTWHVFDVRRGGEGLSGAVSGAGEWTWTRPKVGSGEGEVGSVVPETTKAEEDDSEKAMSQEELVQMVESSNGFYVRDYSLWLGWNNIRYITETSLNHAHLLNRTLIVPTRVYVRACEYPHEACAAFAHEVNRGDAVGSDEWRGLSEEEQRGWEMPWGRMMDLEHLRRRGHRVLTMREFLDMHGLDHGLERGNGEFPGLELPTPNPPHALNSSILHLPLTIHRIENSLYDSNGIARTDVALSPIPSTSPDDEGTVDRVRAALAHLDGVLAEGKVVAWDEATGWVRRELGWETDDEVVELWARRAGYERLWSFGNSEGWDMTKSVTRPISVLALRSHIRAFQEEFSELTERIVHLRGEVHLGRPPGAMRFTTEGARDAYGRVVLWDVRGVPAVMELAELVADRMGERAGGRMWMGAHMRRGDFARLGWTQAPTVEAHLGRIMGRLDHGREVLEEIKRDGSAQGPAAAGTSLNKSVWALDTPIKGDPFYLATDERHNLAALHSQNAVLLADLLRPEDRATHLGWPLLFTDVLAEVEQEVLARAAFFYGSSISSVAGGVLNGRARVGRDDRTGVVD